MHSSLADLVASGVSLFGQGTRLLKFRFPESSGLGEESLLPHRLSGEEGLSENYRYTLDCLSADTHLELKRVLGQPAEISLLLPDGGSRLLTNAAQNARVRQFASKNTRFSPHAPSV
jgi:type VI secretion system secreted protein VgrG